MVSDADPLVASAAGDIEKVLEATVEIVVPEAIPDPLTVAPAMIPVMLTGVTVVEPLVIAAVTEILDLTLK